MMVFDYESGDFHMPDSESTVDIDTASVVNNDRQSTPVKRPHKGGHTTIKN